jgi:hypothetical protein
MPQHYGHDDGHDDLSALDFDATSSGTGLDAGDALDFSSADDGLEESGFDALDDFAPVETTEPEDDLAAVDAATEVAEDEDEEEGAQLFTVTNPPETVSVSATIGGGIQRVSLSPKATGMTESELSDEILVLAGLARKKGLAGQHSYLVDCFDKSEMTRDIGWEDGPELREFLGSFVGLPSPEEADTAQAEVFAARYNANHD